jgi:antitoxin (DNA-binding transcriptional repressor) of toxin-antitoxin stability system
MKAVGVKTLKARLSEYLRLVKAGETILVTDRDEVVAELRPTQRQGLAPASLEEGLALLADQGAATLRSDDRTKWGPPRSGQPVDDISSKEILDALREDRR